MTGKARIVALNNKRSNTFGAGASVGLCIDNKGVGIGAIGDPHLIAVEDIVVTYLSGAKFHTHYIGARIGFGHG